MTHSALARAALLILAACGRDAATPPAPRDAPLPAPRDAAPAVLGVDATIARASAWLAAFPADQLRYDAAIGTAAIRRHTDSDALRRADAAARAVADRDADNPMRRMIDPAYRAAKPSTAAWDPPAPGAARINVNRVVVEALHCADNGLREPTIAYATGPMRDDGGFHTTHAVWALAIARDAGCLDAARFEALVRPLLDELRAAQPAAPGAAVRDVDLFAERVLMLRLAGDRDAAIDGWARALAAAQSSDGGFGAPAAGENPYFRYHATLAATWALVEWQRR